MIIDLKGRHWVCTDHDNRGQKTVSPKIGFTCCDCVEEPAKAGNDYT